MLAISKITDTIMKKEAEIIANINQEDLDTYNCIYKEFKKGNVNTNKSFQALFNSFYRLNGAALTPEFKFSYYNIMEKNRNTKDFNDFKIREILLELFDYKNYQGKKCLQFSFTTKLMHTINNRLPIYDSMIKSVFDFKGPHYYNNTDKRIDQYLKQYKYIRETYEQIFEEGILDNIINLFNSRFFTNNLSEVKILDFIFWTFGKLMKESK